MRKKIEWVWEVLDEFTKRAKVIGGWVIIYGSHTNTGAISNAMIFVADRDHVWEIAPPKVDAKTEQSILAEDFAPQPL